MMLGDAGQAGNQGRQARRRPSTGYSCSVRFDLLSDALVDALFVVCEPVPTNIGAGDSLEDASPACLQMLSSSPRLAVSQDVLALRTRVGETMLVEVAPIDGGSGAMLQVLRLS